MKSIKVLLCFIFVWQLSNAQNQMVLTIDECYASAREHYPLSRQKDFIEKSKEYSIDNISRGYLPQLSVNGPITYQSDVTKAPVQNIPGFEELSKDQYKVYGEINQTLYDGGIIREQKQSQEANAITEQQKLETELYKLKERINQLFFGILLIDEQLVQAGLLKQDIENGIKKAEASVANGTALKSSVDVLRAELLKTSQRTIELKSTRTAYLDMLGLFINRSLNNNTVLQKPKEQIISVTINRPELVLYDQQKKNLDIQTNLVTLKSLPKLSLFVQGGYGKPALDMLKNEFDSYYIGGLRFNWLLSGFYTSKKEKQLLDVNRNILDLQKETFLFNTTLNMKQQSSEIKKLEELIGVDREIITLRERIKATATVQLENGSITTSDYLREVNTEDQAKQILLLHQVQLLMTQYNYQVISGN
jgi:outer membrane protein TolC